ncbi:MAG: hypothetical protein QOI89_3576, partial [Solirubrobacteraceae bacterium]|jgi:hypothetical protein|nr:hypothetical protein [Solirubrobacteraceae bacterium]
MGAIRGTGEAKLGGVPLQISALQLLLFFPPHQLAARTIRAIQINYKLYSIKFQTFKP